jgi:hypothetical protein
MAQFYPASPSVVPGQTMWLHVSSGTPNFRVDFYRQASTLQMVGSESFQGGSSASLGASGVDFSWPAFAFAVPPSWRTGAYLAIIVEEVGGSVIDDPANRLATMFFVVRPPVAGALARILYKIPTFTYTAYNELADPPASLYTGQFQSKVSMRRPGCGAGADPWDHIYSDVYDQISARQTFSHWDQKLVQWLEQNGYAVDYCTDLDIHFNENNLVSKYALLLSGGHDEYWSAEMRNHVEAFIASGGNVAFLSGNVCWWRVRVTDNGTALMCDKSAHVGFSGPFDQWWTGQNMRPENSLTGVSYRNAGGNWDGPRPTAAGFTVQHTHHWVFANVVAEDGTLIKDGDVIGDGSDTALVGYECDGALLTAASGEPSRMAAGTDGTPQSFLVLGVADVSSYQDAEAGAASMATMGIYTQGGTVFSAATVDWARVLATGNAQVGQITRNVLDRLRLESITIQGLNGPCSSNPVVEGATIQLRVDTAGMSSGKPVTYSWSVSAGAPGVLNLSTLELKLPMPAEPVTVAVSIANQAGPFGFGTLTFTPMTLAQYEIAAFICRIRDLLANLYRFKAPPYEPFTGVEFVADPLWNQIRGYVGPVPTEDLMRRISRESQSLQTLFRSNTKPRGAA